MRAALVVAIAILATPGFAKEDHRTSGAKEHYEKGLAHFHLQEYQAAIEEFQEAYRLRPDPVFLYNLGQAYRLADNPERALYFYRDFLRTAENPPNRTEVESRIADLEQVLESRKKQLNSPPDHTLPPKEAAEPSAVAQSPAPAAVTSTPIAAAAPPVGTAHERPPVYRRWWFWTALGGVVVAGAAVATIVVLTSSTSNFNASVGTFGPKALTVSW